LQDLPTEVGTRLRQAEGFAHSGNSGRPPNPRDPHLHFEVWWGRPRGAGSVRRDPEVYLNSPCYDSVPEPPPPRRP
jgi:murein DD-endopeptidase MepM/ murein hydrolase activator NlpD